MLVKIFKKKILLLIQAMLLLTACNAVFQNDQSTVITSHNYLSEFSSVTSEGLVNVVIEIPAGSNQKWEVNKTTGHLEWEQINEDSLRVINYLPYPASYGFIPKTLSDKNLGGDGDLLDVFVLGERIERGQVVSCKIIGLIEMTDSGEQDDKFIAVHAASHFGNISSMQELNEKYPGLLDILSIWLKNYKLTGEIRINQIIEKDSAMKVFERFSLE
jgi:inorganic pyrophosphatase